MRNKELILRNKELILRNEELFLPSSFSSFHHSLLALKVAAVTERELTTQVLSIHDPKPTRRKTPQSCFTRGPE